LITAKKSLSRKRTTTVSRHSTRDFLVDIFSFPESRAISEVILACTAQ
jgi:hypothetical protein